MGENDDAPPAEAGKGDAPPAGADQGAPADQNDPYRPDGLPDDFMGASDRETIDKVVAAHAAEKKRADGLRDKLAGGALPKSADEYPEIEYSPEFVEKHGPPAAADDPMHKIAREAAFNAGIPPEAFSRFVPAVLEAAGEAGILEPPLSLEAEVQAAGGEAAYKANMGVLDQRFDGLLAQGKIDEGGREELRVAAATAAGQKALLAVLDLSREQGVEIDPSADGGRAVTVDTVRARMQDDRYDSTGAKFDPEFVKETRRQAKLVGLG